MKKAVFFLCILCSAITTKPQATPGTGYQKYFKGPLKILPQNLIYFTDNSGRAIFLTGSHTWANFQEHITEKQEKKFDWKGYLDMMEVNNHNFIRFWMFEQPEGQAWTHDKILIDPMPYQRLGKELAFDGKPKFDLDKFNQEYFDRMRNRVIDAGDRGIYVSIMLFQGWSQNKLSDPKADPFLSHPFNKTNNINGVDVLSFPEDVAGKPTLHSMGNKKSLQYQEAYVKKVIETVNDLDNVLYEIINEGGTTDWQYHMIDFVHSYEKKMPKQHMVGLGSRAAPAQPNEELWDSPADYISPCLAPATWLIPGSELVEDYGNNPPVNRGKKVVLLDTDHIWGHGGNYVWAWKSFCRGLQPIFMDSWEPIAGTINEETAGWLFTTGGISKNQRAYPDYEPLRKNMGYIRKYADKMNLKEMTPHEELVTTKYCLANPGNEYLIYFPQGGKATVNLVDVKGELELEWFIPSLNRVVKGRFPLKGGYFAVVEPPYTGDAVLYMKKK